MIAVVCIPLLAGCSTMKLLEGKLPIEDEDDLGIVTHPYPGWENKTKETLNRIPTVDEKKRTIAPAPPPAATPTAAAATAGTAASNDNTTVTHEQPPAANPVTTAPPSASVPPALQERAIPPRSPAANPRSAAAPPIVNLPGATVLPAALVRPTQEHPLAVAEEKQVASPETAGDKKKPEPTAAERLSALIKQRGEFLSALKAEVNRRRSSTEDDEELTRLEKELRLVQLAGEEPEEAVRQIEALDGPEKDAFAHLLMGLATWMNPDEALRPTLRNAKIVREIRDAATELAAASKLDVRNLAFCEKVESYGWYTEFPRSQFKPKQQVILYAEVENFTALRIADDSYETELQGSYQIFDSRGNLVDERELPLDKEVCRNYRRDYFLAYLIYLPETISSGNYRLELTVEDKKGTAAPQEPVARRGEKQNPPAKTTKPSSASSYKGRKLGTGTIEFSIK